MLRNVALEQAGPYRVRVSTSVSNRMSDVAWVMVMTRPSILVPIQPQTVVSGGTVSLSVWAGPVHPTLPLSYIWKKNLVAYAVTQTPTLLLSNLTANTSVQVIVSNLAGTEFRPAITVTNLADTDHDGMPDAWETANGLSSTNQADAALDHDGDGRSNLAEYIAGTDPNNSNSVLRLTVAPVGPNGAVVLQFLATTNRSYTVLSRDTLGVGAWTAWTNIPSLPSNWVVRLTNSSSIVWSNRFFRLRTPMAP